MEKKKLTLSFHLDNPLDFLVYKHLKEQGHRITDYIRYLTLLDLQNNGVSPLKAQDVSDSEVKKITVDTGMRTASTQKDSDAWSASKDVDAKELQTNLDQDILLNGLSMFEQY